MKKFSKKAQKFLGLSVISLILFSCNTSENFSNTDLVDNQKYSSFNNTQSDVSLYSKYTLTTDDKVFLEDLSKKSFQFFLEQSDPNTGLTLDRARTNGTTNGENIASSAATGFALTAFCIASERGWMNKTSARKRVFNTLNFFANKAPQERGWYPHFMDQKTGERRWKSEYSSIDTALFLAGVLTAKQYFKNDKEITNLATELYNKVDFKWMLNGHPTLMSHGWNPESGFIPTRWDTNSEHMILQMLSIGSTTHPITPDAWQAWKRIPITYGGYNYISSGPIFTHQFSHAWLDFRNRKDSSGIDYFANSIKATRGHKAYILDLAKRFPGYSENIWGVTASDSANGYLAWGGPPDEGNIDGTVVPCAAGGSLMFTPDITIPALKEMRNKFGKTIYGKYSFVDAFNPNTKWVNPDVIGIDIGITLLSAENLRTGNVWKWFMLNPEMNQAMNLVGLNK